MAAAIIFAVLSALSNACSAVLQRLAVTGRASSGRSQPAWRAAIDLVRQPAWRAAIDLVRQRAWLLGALFLAGTFGFQALALYFGPLSVVQPVLVLELIFALGLRVLLLQLSTSPWHVVGAVVSLGVLAAGVVMLSIWAPPVMTAEELGQLRRVHRPKELTDAAPLV